MVQRFGISRRQFVGGAAIAATAASVGGVGLLVSPAGAGRKGGTSTRPLLTKPAMSAAVGSLVASAGPLGSLQYLFNGGALPVFEHSRGSSADVELTNDLDHETTVHWHGLIVPPSADGQPTEAVAPGGTYRYSFAVDQRASLNFFHPHPHMHTGEQVALGLQGLFVVRDEEEAALGLPADAFEWPLAIRDANFDRKGNLTYAGRNSGELGTVALVNGVKSPRIAGEAGTYRLRLLNSSNARIFRWSFGGRFFWLIGNDGGFLPAPVWTNEVVAGPAERFDVLIDLRAPRCCAASTLAGTSSSSTSLGRLEVLSRRRAPCRAWRPWCSTTRRRCARSASTA